MSLCVFHLELQRLINLYLLKTGNSMHFYIAVKVAGILAFYWNHSCVKKKKPMSISFTNQLSVVRVFHIQYHVCRVCVCDSVPLVFHSNVKPNQDNKK